MKLMSAAFAAVLLSTSTAVALDADVWPPWPGTTPPPDAKFENRQYTVCNATFYIGFFRWRERYYAAPVVAPDGKQYRNGAEYLLELLPSEYENLNLDATPEKVEKLRECLLRAFRRLDLL